MGGVVGAVVGGVVGEVLPSLVVYVVAVYAGEHWVPQADGSEKLYTRPLLISWSFTSRTRIWKLVAPEVRPAMMYTAVCSGKCETSVVESAKPPYR